MAEVKYFIFCIVAFLVSEAIVEYWDSVIDSVVRNKVALNFSGDHLT